MAEKPPESPEKTDLTTFITEDYYIVGAGETVVEVRTTGEWLATDTPAEVRR